MSISPVSGVPAPIDIRSAAPTHPPLAPSRAVVDGSGANFGQLLAAAGGATPGKPGPPAATAAGAPEHAGANDGCCRPAARSSAA